MQATLTLPTRVVNDLGELLERYRAVRRETEKICAPLETEDFMVQAMPDASPTKWHLAHTTWFFETFVLGEHLPGYEPFHPRFRYLFNSYYNAIGSMHARPFRGFLSRPTVREVFAYRRHVDEAMTGLMRRASEPRLERDSEPKSPPIAALVTLGLHHEQQHQELMLTDLKTVFGANPLAPAYRKDLVPRPLSAVDPLKWAELPGGLVRLGVDPRDDVFAYDNEMPSHQRFAQPFQIADRLVTAGEYLGFLRDGGYESPLLWLSDGWTQVQAEQWKAPLYWEEEDGEWFEFTLGGRERLRLEDPVCHVSFYEADAFARWSGARLPTELEWELTAGPAPVRGNLLDRDHLHPRAVDTSEPEQRSSPGKGLREHSGAGARSELPDSPWNGFVHPSAPEVPIHQLFGDVWEWTGSPYSPYPGYRPAEGALGEYNAKFMCNQMVLRGGSCVTPSGHLRPTYRNFWAPETRFQFSGIRLARDGRH